MAFTVEEVRIKLGLDASAAQAQAGSPMFGKLGAKIGRSFSSSLTRVFTMGLTSLFAGYGLFQLLEKGAEKLGQFFGKRAGEASNAAFNIGDLVASRLQKIADTIRTLREKLNATKDDLLQAQEAFVFKNVSDAGKLEMIRQRQEQNRKATKETAESAEIYRKEMEASDKGSEKRAFWLEKTKAGELKINQLKIEAIDLEEKRRAVLKHQTDESNRLAAAAEREAAARGNAYAAGLKAAQDVDAAKGERGKFQLGDLANLPITRWTTREQAGNIMAARKVSWLEADAKKADMLGNTDHAKRQRSRADELRKGITSLREDERFPFKRLEDEAKRTSDAMEQILKAAGNAPGKGLLVTPAD